MIKNDQLNVSNEKNDKVLSENYKIETLKSNNEKSDKIGLNNNCLTDSLFHSLSTFACYLKAENI